MFDTVMLDFGMLILDFGMLILKFADTEMWDFG